MLRPYVWAVFALPAGEVSTLAVASWMSGESMQEAVENGEEVWQIFGQLAATGLRRLPR